MQIQPQSLCFFALIAFSQTLVYHKSVLHQRKIKRSLLIASSGWETWRACMVTSFIAAAFAGTENLLVLTLRVLRCHSGYTCQLSLIFL